MTSLLSTISGQFTRNLILGYFLPVVVFVALGMIFIVPIFPADWPLLKPFLGFGVESKVIGLTLVAIVMTGVLFNLNIPLLRLYEGYPWRNSLIGKAMTLRKRKQFAMARARRRAASSVSMSGISFSDKMSIARWHHSVKSVAVA